MTNSSVILQNEIENLCTETTTSCRFFLTSQADVTDEKDFGNSYGRINLGNLKDAIDCFNEEPICFICGPPNFIDTMVESLVVLGLKPGVIKYEKWW